MKPVNRWFVLIVSFWVLGITLSHAEDIVLKRYVTVEPDPNDPDATVEAFQYEDQVTFYRIFNSNEVDVSTVTATQVPMQGTVEFGDPNYLNGLYHYVVSRDTVIVTDPAGSGLMLRRQLQGLEEQPVEPIDPTDPPAPVEPMDPVDSSLPPPSDPEENDDGQEWQFDTGRPQLAPSTNTEGEQGANEDGDDQCSAGMAFYSPNLALASLRLRDVPLSYRAAFGPNPLIRVTYDDGGPTPVTIDGMTNLGPRWSLNWVRFIVNNAPMAVEGQEPHNISMLDTSREGGYVGTGSGGAIALPRPPAPPPGATSIVVLPALPSHRSQIQIATNTGRMERRLPGGTVEIYDSPMWMKDQKTLRRLVAVRDRAGNELTIAWEGLRITKLIDATGGETKFYYVTNETGTNNPNARHRGKIARIVDPRGRVAQFHYNAEWQLSGITDPVGVTSSFSYSAQENLVTQLQTPLGNTQFIRSSGVDWHRLDIKDALNHTERVELRYTSVAVGALAATENGSADEKADLASRNTLHWNKRAMHEAGGNDPAVTDATIYHWMSLRDRISVNLASVKPPGQARVWFTYLNQPAPGYLSDVLPIKLQSIRTTDDEGESRSTTFTWNSEDQPLAITDPQGRLTTLTYHAGDMDVHTVSRTAGGVTNLLGTFTGYTKGRPQTIVDQSGATTSVLYNTQGQLTNVTGPDGQETIITYRTQGQSGYGRTSTVTRKAAVLPGVTTPADLVSVYDYDFAGRIQAVTNPSGYKVTYAYDAVPREDLGELAIGSLDRLTTMTFPDNTNERIEFDGLWLSASYDRLGRKTSYEHDALGNIEKVTDPAGRLVRFSRNICCGLMEELIDGNNNITQWKRDIAGRVTEKKISGTTVASYEYAANTGRLIAETDAKGNRKEYSYTPDGEMAQVSYLVAAGTAPTGSVTFGYDALGRLETMSDPTGLTTWSYHASGSEVGQLKEVNKRTMAGGPLFERLQYNYDTNGRLATRKVGVDQASETYDYDGFGRLVALRNPLGATAGSNIVLPFNWTYGGPGGALSAISAPNGLETILEYGTNAQDHRLTSLVHRQATNPSTQYSVFSYQWDAVGRLKQWNQSHPVTTGGWIARNAAYDYNAADELTTAVVKNQLNVEIGQWVWGYDGAGNRTREQHGSELVSWTANEFNQLRSRSGGGQMVLRGSVDRAATVTVNGEPAEMNGLHWSKQVTANVGVNSYSVAATEPPPPPPEPNPNSLLDPSDPAYEPPTDPPPQPAPQTAWGRVNYTVAASAPKSLEYDDNGNLVHDGERGYEWDAENRLVAVTGAWGRTEFSYDGMWRRVKLVEKNTNGAVIAERRFAWEDLGLIEERDASDAVVKRFWGLGEERLGVSPVNLTYTRDHLGSVREILDGSGAVRVRYDYDEWGKRTKLEGDIDCDFGFTGHFEHEHSGITLAPYRGYRAELGRWLNRDPLGEKGGLNIYCYVKNEPQNLIDPTGQCPLVIAVPPLLEAIGAEFLGSAAATGLLIGGAAEMGKNDPHANQDKKNKAKEEWEKAQNELAELKRKPNKGPEDKKRLDDLRRKASHLKKIADWKGETHHFR